MKQKQTGVLVLDDEIALEIFALEEDDQMYDRNENGEADSYACEAQNNAVSFFQIHFSAYPSC